MGNSEVMTEIQLYGQLGKLYGKTHHRLIRTIREAPLALGATIKGFEQFMRNSARRGLTFAVFRGKENIGQDDLGYPVTSEIIKIVPIVIGSKRAGILQTILGAALVAVGAIATFGFGQAWGVNVMLAGGSIIAGGVIQMLSPQPTGLASKQDSANEASYAFGGVTNTASQGYPVPLGYGRRRVGGAIISAGIYVEDQQ